MNRMYEETAHFLSGPGHAALKSPHWIRHTTHAGKSPSLFCGVALKALEVVLEASRKPLSTPGGSRNNARMPELGKRENRYPKFCSNQWTLRLNAKAHVCRWIQNCSCSRVENEAGIRAMQAGARQFEFKRVDHALKYIPQSQVSRSPDHTQIVRGAVQYRSIHEGSQNVTHSLGQRINMGDHKPAKVLEEPDKHWKPLRNTLRWKANHSRKSSGELEITERSRRFLCLVKMWRTRGKSAVAMQGCPTLYQSLTAPQCPQIKPNTTQNGHKLSSVQGYFGNIRVICACMRV